MNGMESLLLQALYCSPSESDVRAQTHDELFAREMLRSVFTSLERALKF